MGNKKINRDGYKLEIGSDEKRKIIPDQMNYHDPNHSNEIHAHGHPIAVDVAELMIGSYWQDLKKVPDYEKKYVAFIVGKEPLLSILSQKDCVAIRFYLAKWDKDFFKTTPTDPAREMGETLVAVGVKSKDQDIGAKSDKPLIVSPIDDKWKADEIILSHSDDGEIREMVPPSTIEELKRIGKREESDELAKVIAKFF